MKLRLVNFVNKIELMIGKERVPAGGELTQRRMNELTGGRKERRKRKAYLNEFSN